MASTSVMAECSSSLPEVDLALADVEDKMILDMEYDGKIPLRYWRLEMWTREGRLLAKAEGSEMPVKVEFDDPGDRLNQEIFGFVFVQDTLGKQRRVDVQERLPELKRTHKKKEVKPKGTSEKWVNDF
jgi:hypothetical protein